MAVACSQAQRSGKQTVHSGSEVNTSLAGWRAGGLAGWATADSTLQALLSAWLLEQRAAKCPCSRGRPGFCRGCRAPPRPGSGRESDVRGGSGALKHPSVPSCVGNYATTPVRGVGAGCRAAALSGGSLANTNKPGHMHKSTRIGSFLACKGL